MILSGRSAMLIATSLFTLSQTSCDRSKQEVDVAKADTPTQAGVEIKAPEIKPAATPPLAPTRLEQIAKMGALVQIPDKPSQPGILIEGARGNSSKRNYLVICEAPADCKSVGIACRSYSGIEKSFAKRISTLPSGLSLFGFTSKSSLTCSRLMEPVAGETFHAIQLKGEGSIPAEETAAMTAELETIRNQIAENQSKRFQGGRPMPGTGPSGMRPPGMRPSAMDPRQGYQARLQELAAMDTEAKALAERQSEFSARLKIPITSITAIEVAANTTRDALETVGKKLENSLLATSSGDLRAIRLNGKWLEIKDILATSGDQLESVKLDLSGGQQNASVSCELMVSIPSAENTYSMIAATTVELETQGSGSLEERLATVKPVPFQGSGGNLSARHQVSWNGSKTKLWLKVFNDKDPAKLILDEVILLDYPGDFSARWGKPPSPLISIPSASPNMPEDLVKEQQSINAKGEIRDLIAAGDGSVVMVQTNQPPYWAPFDLKTGQWMSVPWRATADTLLATQGGKIYLIDRKTKILESWGMVSNKRETIQLLPLQGPITAVAAPLNDPSQPLMATTEKNGFFLDPVKFDVLPSNLDLEAYFDAEAGKRRGQTPVDPATICIRASDDGSLYSFSGTSGSANRTSRSNLILTVDRSAMVLSSANDSQVIATRGRNLARGFPDHGGSELTVTPSTTNGRFPGPPGEIRFADAKERNGFAVMKNPPALPNRNEGFKSYLVSDRGMYPDSSLGVMLLPDGETLHLVRLNLPERKKQLPPFLFVGESLEIPLPVGTGHKLISENGGKTDVGPTSIRWFPPVGERNSQFSLKLEWTGELGSQITQDHQVRVVQPIRSPEVLAPNGTKSVPLRLRGILSDVGHGIVGFAGSGTVVLVNEGSYLTAWNLATAEMLLRVKKNSKRFFGDADRIYVLEHDGKLTSYDIQTGGEVGQVELGNKIQSIATGISSRDALLAVEQEGVNGFLVQIPRDTLKPLIVDLPKETCSRLFIPQLVANASGSAVWSRGVGIFRDARAVTVTSYPYELVNGLSDGVPDASGQFIIGRDGIIDLGSKPPKSAKISSLTGAAESARCNLDQSGRYLFISGSTEEPQGRRLSLRDVREPSKELLKIQCPMTGGGDNTWIISHTNTLVQFLTINGNAKAAVYDFDVTGLTQQLSR